MAKYWYHQSGRGYWIEVRAWDEWGNECIVNERIERDGTITQRLKPTAPDQIALIRRQEELRDAQHYAKLRDYERKTELVAAELKLLNAQGRLEAPPAVPQPQVLRLRSREEPTDTLKREKIIDDALAVLRREYRASGHSTDEIDALLTARKPTNGSAH